MRAASLTLIFFFILCSLFIIEPTVFEIPDRAAVPFHGSELDGLAWIGDVLDRAAVPLHSRELDGLVSDDFLRDHLHTRDLGESFLCHFSFLSARDTHGRGLIKTVCWYPVVAQAVFFVR
jgi:hypothetical protein